MLFICNQGQHRSRTAAELFGGSYAGIYSASRPVTRELLAQADVVVVFEEAQRAEIAARFPKLYLQKRILCLDVSDVYHYNQPELVQQLQERMKLLEPLI